MARRVRYIENTSYLVIVKGAAYAGRDSNMPKCANTHELANDILAISSTKIVFAHVLFGPDHLLVMVKGNSPTEAKEMVRAIRRLQEGRHSYVSETHSHIISAMFGRDPTREAWADRATLGAWVFTKVGRPNPGDVIPNTLFERSRTSNAIKFVAPVFGQYDMFVFIEGQSIEQIGDVVDNEIRSNRNISETDTRITYQNSP
jgi:DNA-binding Lrp family transcriptional regulator